MRQDSRITGFEVVHLQETASTNAWLLENGSDHDCAVWADYQTAGRGCGTNKWESERGMNLLFSVLVHPVTLSARQQFYLSMAVSLAFTDVLAACGVEPLSIKWPNDIYWRDRKLCGILIENKLSGTTVRQSIIGAGLNVNQTLFLSDAPNPVSMKQILGKDTDREQLLNDILRAFSSRLTLLSAGDTALRRLHDDYLSRLYRRDGFHSYHDADGDFEARIVTVEASGHLLLQDREGRERRYGFKEVNIIL
jgi:BirA family biotin operon repressor/biotin-[acetyl-CoA-carboxylase] ligase